MARASTSKKTVKESSTSTTTKTTNATKKTTARKTTKTSAASKAATTKQRAPKSSSKQAPTKTKTSTRACTTSKKTTTKVKASPVVPPTPVVEEKPKRVRKTKATKSVENITTNNTTDLVWVNPSTGLTSTAHYDPTKQIVECKLSISDGKTDNPVTASFSLGVVKQLLQANYNIAVFVLQKSIYSFDFKRVDFEKFLRDNGCKFNMPKLSWV